MSKCAVKLLQLKNISDVYCVDQFVLAALIPWSEGILALPFGEKARAERLTTGVWSVNIN